LYVKTDGTFYVLNDAGEETQLVPVPALPPGYLFGLTLSNNTTDATNDIDIAAGKCRDSTDSISIVAAAMTKQLDAGWAAGTNQGMRNSAAAITDTTYHIYAVAKADGTQDFYAHTSTTVATVLTALQAETGGADYLYARRICSIVRASAAIKAFVQVGDDFTWKAGSVQDVDATNPGTAAVTRTLTVPIGIVVDAKLSFIIDAVTSTGFNFLLTPLDVDDVVADVINDTATLFNASGIDQQHGGTAVVRTNTSGQIRSRVSVSGTSDRIRLNTSGWIDRRGREA
jgi:hypothetical protein